MENPDPIKMDDLGVPLFSETPICVSKPTFEVSLRKFMDTEVCMAIGCFHIFVFYFLWLLGEVTLKVPGAREVEAEALMDPKHILNLLGGVGVECRI